MTDLSTAARKSREWTDRRDHLIREARKNGHTYRQIAAEVGMSHTAVRFICEGRTDRKGRQP